MTQAIVIMLPINYVSTDFDLYSTYYKFRRYNSRDIFPIVSLIPYRTTQAQERS